MRTVFFGTPDFAVPTLAALAASDHRPELVVTQPARPAGRGGKLREPPVAEWARTAGIEVVQPEKVRDPAFLERLESLAPDAGVVVAFGQIFRRRLLELPRLGCINLHASLLPRWRGAAPIQAAIAAGDHETGVTTMRMDRGLDTGPMLLVHTTPLTPHETTPELAERLATIGGSLMVETLDRLATDDLESTPQDDAAATLAPRITRDDGIVDWRWPAVQIYDRWRAFQPWPGLTTTLDDTPLKLKTIQPPASRQPATNGTSGARTTTAQADGIAPGTLLDTDEDALRVVCGGGTILDVLQVQRPGKKAISGRDLVHGERLRTGGHVFTLPPAGHSTFALPCA